MLSFTLTLIAIWSVSFFIGFYLGRESVREEKSNMRHTIDTMFEDVDPPWNDPDNPDIRIITFRDKHGIESHRKVYPN